MNGIEQFICFTTGITFLWLGYIFLTEWDWGADKKTEPENKNTVVDSYNKIIVERKP